MDCDQSQDRFLFFCLILILKVNILYSAHSGRGETSCQDLFLRFIFTKYPSLQNDLQNKHMLTDIFGK